MDNLTIKQFTRNITRKSPEILTALGVVGVVSTTLMAIKATPLALRAMQQHEIEYYDYYGDDAVELTELERIYPGLKFYIPTVISAGLTIMCIIGAHRVSSQRNAALAALYTMSETKLVEYQDKVSKTFGEKKEAKLSDELAKDEVDKHPISEGDTNIIITGRGDHLCFDALSSRYFMSDIERIRQAVNSFNESMLNGDMYKTLNEFYDDIGLKPTELGQNMGWSIDTGLLDIKFTAVISDNNVPCIVLNFPIHPRYL